MLHLKLADKMAANMVRNRQDMHNILFKGVYKAQFSRGGVIYAERDIFNDITNEGKNHILDVMFSDETQIASTSWFIGLISSTSYSALAAGDTMSSHAGWTEFTGYSQTNRVAWGPGAASGQAITNSTPATFSFTSTGTVKGGFLTTNNSKSGTSGKLWSTGLFTADVAVVNGDELKITYNLSC